MTTIPNSKEYNETSLTIGSVKYELKTFGNTTYVLLDGSNKHKPTNTTKL